MSTQTSTLLPVTPIPQAIGELLKQHQSEMPIVNAAGEYCGIFSESCCMRILETLANFEDGPTNPPTAFTVMVPLSKLLTFAPKEDIYVAIEALLEHGYSGAPVIDLGGKFLGVFTQRTCMGFVIEAAYNGLPTAAVGDFLDLHSNGLVDAEIDLHAIAKVFNATAYGCLPVTRDGSIIGQVSRRDVLTHPSVIPSIMVERVNAPDLDTQRLQAESEIYIREHDTLPDHTVSTYANFGSCTVEPKMNFFTLARLFLTSSYRSFPVVEDKKFLGQVNRSDILRAALEMLR